MHWKHNILYEEYTKLKSRVIFCGTNKYTYTHTHTHTQIHDCNNDELMIRKMGSAHSSILNHVCIIVYISRAYIISICFSFYHSVILAYIVTSYDNFSFLILFSVLHIFCFYFYFYFYFCIFCLFVLIENVSFYLIFFLYKNTFMLNVHYYDFVFTMLLIFWL